MADKPAPTSNATSEVSQQVERALIGDAVRVLQNDVTAEEDRYRRGIIGVSRERVEHDASTKKAMAEHPSQFLPLGGWNRDDIGDISQLTDAKAIGRAISHQCVSEEKFLSRDVNGAPELLIAHRDMSGHKTVVEHFVHGPMGFASEPRYEVKEANIEQACNGIVNSIAKGPAGASVPAKK